MEVFEKGLIWLSWVFLSLLTIVLPSITGFFVGKLWCSYVKPKLYPTMPVRSVWRKNPIGMKRLYTALAVLFIVFLYILYLVFVGFVFMPVTALTFTGSTEYTSGAGLVAVIFSLVWYFLGSLFTYGVFATLEE